MTQGQLAKHYNMPIDHPSILNIVSRKKAAGLYRLHPEVPEDSGDTGRSSMEGPQWSVLSCFGQELLRSLRGGAWHRRRFSGGSGEP
eukprot:15086259-Alexandrium_andersonii.AAC.1